MEQIVIVGAGQSGGTVAVELRKQGYAGEIHIVGEEPDLPYQRPPLSKQYLQGALGPERLLVKPQSWWADNRITVHHERVETLDIDNKRVALAGSGWITWSQLVLATGVAPVRLPVAGSELAGIHYLRTRQDSDSLRAALQTGKRLVVVGGGYIGLEVAAVAVEMGLQVEIIEMAERILQRVTSPFISEFYTAVHTAHGVTVHTNCGLEGFAGDQRVEGVLTSTGETLPADVVVVGVGVRAQIELAENAGLDCNNGITVDEYCRTAHPDIYACGDCTNHPNALLGVNLRLESVHNALEQARTVAAAIAGEPRPYNQIPWFWSDQYDLKLQLAGIIPKDARGVLRGSTEQQHFLYFYLDGDNRLRAVEAINQPREFLALRKVLDRFPVVDDVDALADASNDYLATLTG